MTGTETASAGDMETEYQVPEHPTQWSPHQSIIQEKHNSYLLCKQIAVVFITQTCISVQP